MGKTAFVSSLNQLLADKYEEKLYIRAYYCSALKYRRWTQTAGAGQRWQIVEAGGGKVKLRNVLADKVIELVGMRVENVTQAQIWPDVFGENQLWKLDPVPERLLHKETPAPTPKAAPRKAAAKPCSWLPM